MLERVSILELRQAQLAEALQGVVGVLREQSQILKEERDLIKDLYGIVGQVSREQKRFAGGDSSPEEPDAPTDVDEVFRMIVAGHGAGNSEVLIGLLRDGWRLLRDGSERQGLRMLERALLLSPRNPALLVYLALQFFIADRFSRAAEMADDALALTPDDPKALLLSGVAHAELGHLDQAKRNLSLLVNDQRFRAIVNFAWGMFSAIQANWTESIAAFKQCGSAPEMEYLIACAYFQLRRYPKALKHLGAVVETDPDYADAWFMQSIVFGELGDFEKERAAFGRASDANDPESQCHESLKRRRPVRNGTAPPFRHLANQKNALLSGGSTRIRRFYRDLVMGVLGDA